MNGKSPTKIGRALDRDLGILQGIVAPGVCLRRAQIAQLTGCTRQALEYIEARALRTVRRRLARVMGLKETDLAGGGAVDELAENRIHRYVAPVMALMVVGCLLLVEGCKTQTVIAPKAVTVTSAIMPSAAAVMPGVGGIVWSNINGMLYFWRNGALFQTNPFVRATGPAAFDCDTAAVPYQVNIVHEEQLQDGCMSITAVAEFPQARLYTLMKNTGGSWYPVINSHYTPPTTPQRSDSEGLLFVDDAVTNGNAMYLIKAQ